MAKNITIKPKTGKSLLATFEELSPFYAFRREMDRLFDSFFRGFDIEPFRGSEEFFNPSVDVIDDEKEIKVTVELPGLDEKDIDLSLTADSLTIKGEKKKEKEEKGKNYHRTERMYGAFSRTIPLPVEIETDKAEASFKKGVLTITLPKSAKALKETKKIPIKAQ